jgi:hypothetical protein
MSSPNRSIQSWTMKTKKAKVRSSDKASRHHQPQQLIAKAAAAEKLAEAARKHWRVLKIEQKQARKAFKQAKKAAKLARKDARTGPKSRKDSPKKVTAAKKAKRLKAEAVLPKRSVIRKRVTRVEANQSIVRSKIPDSIPPAVIAMTAENFSPAHTNPSVLE